ncbi:hypothetical protein [Streptomyces sp. SAJ15]|uniref:hypothetical protein n=1 Tax=Streptomyces sp. SAJ15 TaxID=2011095 RepID=UPI0011865B40|nr:hypothetical protein [Streptomyces sp. SAJ15]TVL93780.1 hypothetical protein CD790_01655 [Streptomyces sp. SAJ15]
MTHHSTARPHAHGLVLYARSRALPGTVLALLAVAALTTVGAQVPEVYLDPAQRIRAEALAPVFAACAIGISTYQHSPALDATAVRPWPPRRLAHLTVLTLIAGLALVLATPSASDFIGTWGLLRNLLGGVGVALAAATVIGARLSWAPTLVYLTMLYLSRGDALGRAHALWAWAAQPGAQPWSWIPAATAFLVGTALFVTRGPLPENGRD